MQLIKLESVIYCRSIKILDTFKLEIALLFTEIPNTVCVMKIKLLKITSYELELCVLMRIDCK